MPELKKNCLEMFDFLHDVITDIAYKEDTKWFELFNEEFDKLRANIEEAR